MDLLLVASLVFYASWSIPFLFHFILIITINYFVMEYYRKTKVVHYFILLQIFNLCNLVFFKYFYFLADILGKIFSIDWFVNPNLLNIHKSNHLEIILPLGISFYTFQIIAYGVDIYRNQYKEKHSLKQVILFISFFPQLIAGPILRAKDLLPAICDYENYAKNREDLVQTKKGIWLILLGVCKKLFISDTIIPVLIHYTSQKAESLTFVIVFFLCIAFMIMLYSDFSAYSDIARGLGYLLGFEISVNFRAPFFMSSFTDLWKRWHITFSTWIRDYIFIPLGGSKGGELILYRNILITFTLGGIWHGANLTFLMWGFLMGLFLCFEAFLNNRGITEDKYNYSAKALRFMIVWILYLSIGIFFFAPNFQWAMIAIQKFFTINIESMIAFKKESILHFIPILLLITLFFQWLESEETNFEKMRKWENYTQPVAIVILFFLITQIDGQAKDFFYFQF